MCFGSSIHARTIKGSTLFGHTILGNTVSYFLAARSVGGQSFKYLIALCCNGHYSGGENQMWVYQG